MERTPRQAATIGGILGLVGAAVGLAATLFVPNVGGFWGWMGWLAWPLVAGLFAVLALLLRKRWPLFAVGGLVSMGVYGIVAYLSELMMVLNLQSDSPSWGHYGRAAATGVAASAIVLAGGLIAFLGREQEQGEMIVNEIAAPVEGS
jgi:hypothetical protein